MSSTRDSAWADPDEERTQVIDLGTPPQGPARPDLPPQTHERDVARPDPRGTPDWDLQLARISNRPLTDVGLLALRLCSLPLVLHGIFHLGTFGSLVDSLPEAAGPAAVAVAVGLVMGQLLLPPLLAVGFLTRVAALAQTVLMAGEYALLVLPRTGALDAATGALAGESVLGYAALALPLLFTGAGRFSIDQAVGAQGRERRVEKRVARRLGA